MRNCAKFMNGESQKVSLTIFQNIKIDGFQNRTELSISSLTPGDIGNYTCSAAKDKSVSLGIIIVIIIMSLLSLKQ